MKRSVFHLPPALLAHLEVARWLPSTSPAGATGVAHDTSAAPMDLSLTCLTCEGMAFRTPLQKRAHMKSDLHVHRLRSRLAQSDGRPISPRPRAAGEATSSSDEYNLVSSSDSASDADVAAITVALPRATRLSRSRVRPTSDPSISEAAAKARALGEGLAMEPMVWFHSAAAPASTEPEATGDYLGIYQTLLASTRRQHYSLTAESKPVGYRTGPAADPERPIELDQLCRLQAPAAPPSADWAFRWWAILLVSGGRFAGAVFDNATGKMVHHKTIQRYTTRRKQGGSQSKNDQAKGSAHSAGASLRRYNQAALESDIRAILLQWAPAIQSCSHVFIGIPKTERKLYLEGTLLYRGSAPTDQVRNLPFAYLRPTLDEVQRCYDRLTTVRPVTSVSPSKAGEGEAPPRATSLASPHGEPSSPSLLGISLPVGRQLLTLIHSNDNPRQFLTCVRRHCINLNDPLPVELGHATLLHAASSLGRPQWVALLLAEGADPTPSPSSSSEPYLAGRDAATRLAYTRFRQQRPRQWDWATTRVPEHSASPEIRSTTPARSLPSPSAPPACPPPPADPRATTTFAPSFQAPPLPTGPPAFDTALVAPALPTSTVLPKPKEKPPPPPTPVVPAANPGLLQRVQPSVVWGALSALPSYLTDLVTSSAAGPPDTPAAPPPGPPSAPPRPPAKSARELRAEAAERRLRGQG
ncbi:hypothetical protein H4R33_003409 [Dimargaris cristalligena]|nr:hypothetical protein H4R33_003409 [Dimargaris cristalligena]